MSLISPNPRGFFTFNYWILNKSFSIFQNINSQNCYHYFHHCLCYNIFDSSNFLLNIYTETVEIVSSTEMPAIPGITTQWKLHTIIFYSIDNGKIPQRLKVWKNFLTTCRYENWSIIIDQPIISISSALICVIFNPYAMSCRTFYVNDFLLFVWDGTLRDFMDNTCLKKLVSITLLEPLSNPMG